MPPASRKPKSAAPSPAPVQAPKALPPPQPKAPKLKAGKRKLKSLRTRGGNFQRYIHSLLKQIHPDIAISSRSMEIVNSFVNDMFERIVAECVRILSYSGGKTLSSKTVQTACRLVVGGELAKHAVSEGIKAVGMYTGDLVNDE